MTSAVFLAGATALLLGARHGLDWDHLAAIADLAGAPSAEGRRSLGLALWYCIGHGSVIVALGAAIGMLGIRIPGGLDWLFEAAVGATLIGLGILVLRQVASERRGYRYRSRWRLLIEGVRRRGRRATAASVEADDAAVSPRAALAVGILHGAGAETPTQIVLFVSAAAARSAMAVGIVILMFVAGLIASDLGVAVVWLRGHRRSARTPVAHLAFGLATAAMSIGVGATFIVGRAAILPSLFGG